MKLIFVAYTLIFAVCMADAVLALPNPAAIYCEKLGYEYRVVKTPQEEEGMCIVKPGVEFDAWDFFKGKVGKEYSYCAKHGYDTETEHIDKGAYSVECTVCVSEFTNIRGEIRTPMPELMEQNGDPLIDDESYKKRVVKKKERLNQLDSKTLTIHDQLPSTFDWRDKDGHTYVGPIHDQGICGSCYAFAAVGCLESAIMINLQMPDLPIDLSEQVMVDCGPEYSSEIFGCLGAYSGAELDFLQQYGAPEESCFPYYAGGSKSCSDACSEWHSQAYKITDWIWVIPNVEAIKSALYTYGPLEAGMDVDNWFAWYYQGGVYDGNGGCINQPDYINHAVMIVGWQDNPPEGGGGCWIVKNSWGTNWGEEGYFRIRWDACAISLITAQVYFEENVSTITTTAIPTTTTATINVQDCLVEEIYGEYSEETDLLRYFRDNVLSKTPGGQEIIRLYYEWSPIIVKVIEEDEEFKEDVKEMIDEGLLLITEKAE